MSFRSLKKTLPFRIVYKGLSRGFFLLVLLNLLFFPPSLQSQTAQTGGGGKPVGVVEKVRGSFEIIRSDGVLRERASVGLPIYLGDRLETGTNGLAKVRFIDKSVLTLGNKTTIRVSQYLVESNQKNRNAVLNLIVGEIRLIVEPYLGWSPFRPFQYQVRTGSAVAGIRGTDLLVRVLANGLSEVYCMDGSLAVKGTEVAGQPVELAAGNFSRIPLGAAPSQPLKFQPAIMEKILNQMGEPLPRNLAQKLPVRTGQLPAKGPVRQGQWAQMLSESLGLGAAVQDGLDEKRYVELLSGGKAQLIEAERFSEQSKYLAREDAKVEVASGGAYMEAKSLSGTLRFPMVVPQGGKYPLQIKSRGTVLVSIGNQTVVAETDPDEEEMKWQDLGQLKLTTGENIVQVVVSRGSSVDAFKIDSRCADPIIPAGGWQVGQLLNFGVKAETMVKAMDQEGGLPVDDSFMQILRAVNSTRIKGNYERIVVPTKGNQGVTRERRAIRAGASSATSLWSIKFPSTGVYSFSVRAGGTAPFQWRLDGCDIGRHLPELPELSMIWEEVSSRSFEEGVHTLEIDIPAGATLEAVRIVRRSGRAVDYLNLLTGLGFDEGDTKELVDAEAAQKNLDNEFYRNFLLDATREMLTEVPEAPEKIAEGPPVYLPEEEFPYGSPASPVLPGVF